jgi:hypothetical protein
MPGMGPILQKTKICVYTAKAACCLADLKSRSRSGLDWLGTVLVRAAYEVVPGVVLGPFPRPVELHQDGDLEGRCEIQLGGEHQPWTLSQRMLGQRQANSSARGLLCPGICKLERGPSSAQQTICSHRSDKNLQPCP